MSNRLTDSQSLYLRQHAENPVDWYPWSSDAFAKANDEDKPVFLSIGYSSCHWCHVMEEESFVRSDVADVLNKHFISIKVDREELPDVDDTYMTAVQLSSGRGGWPMSLFLLPDKRPFFAGTYIPRDDYGGRPGFLSISRQIAALWETKREAVEQQAAEFADAVAQTLGREVTGSNTAFDSSFLAHSIAELSSDFDPDNGGFGGAPKFPPHSTISFLLSFALASGSREAEVMAFKTLAKMQHGGIHDHVGGGFHRYSTDAIWLLPHFEKMLYDNALMLSNYARASAIASGNMAKEFARTAARTAEWMLRDMRTPEGLFCSALDADSDGEEGKFYIWTHEEVQKALNHSEFLRHYNVRPGGNFHDEATGQPVRANVLHQKSSPSSSLDRELETLRLLRENRPKPLRDEKALVGWNGLAIAGLCDAGLLDHAKATARAILQAEVDHGSLPHAIFGGAPNGNGYLEDYANFAIGLFKLGEADVALGSGDGFEWSDEATRLTEEMIHLFLAPGDRGFYSTSIRHEELFGRTRPVFDSPIPSANAMAIECLTHAGNLPLARLCLSSLLGWMEKVPQATEALHEAGLKLLALGPIERESAITFELRNASQHGTRLIGEILAHIQPGYHLRAPFEVEAEGFEFESIEQGYAFSGRTEQSEVRFTITYELCTETECAPAAKSILVWSSRK